MSKSFVVTNWYLHITYVLDNDIQRNKQRTRKQVLNFVNLCLYHRKLDIKLKLGNENETNSFI